MKKNPPIHGLMAEFDRPDRLVAAARWAHKEGYRRIDAFTPFPVEGLAEALGLGHPWSVSFIVLIGGIVGCLSGYLLQYYVHVLDYPMNIGGRPFHSWPAFIPVTFEVTVLFAALSAFLGVLALNGLPKPYHPVFNVPGFAMATRDRFFLLIEATDVLFDYERTRRFLAGLQPREVSDVEC